MTPPNQVEFPIWGFSASYSVSVQGSTKNFCHRKPRQRVPVDVKARFGRACDIKLDRQVIKSFFSLLFSTITVEILEGFLKLWRLRTSQTTRFARFLTSTRSMATTTEAPTAGLEAGTSAPAVIRPKLHGRAFYESIGSPKYILAPMVDQSEFVGFFPPLSLLPQKLVERRGIVWERDC